MKTFITLIAFFVANSLLSQTPEWDNIQFNNDVFHIDKKDSIVWAVTSAGIVKLNANTDENRLYNRANTPLSGNWQDISAIAIDSSGNFWAGYSDFKVDRIIGDECESFDLIELLNLSDVPNFTTYRTEITNIRTSPNGDVNFWLQTGGLAIYNSGEWSHHYIDQDFYNCNDFEVGLNNELYLLHSHSLSIFYNADSVEKVSLPIENILYSIATRGDEIFIGDSKGRLSLFKNDSLKTILDENSITSGRQIDDIIYQQNVNNFYINAGNRYFVLGGNNFEEVEKIENSLQQDILINCMIPDIFGNIWFGTNKGIFEGEENKYFAESRISDNFIYDLFPDGKDVYIATENEIKRFNSGEWILITDDEKYLGRKSNFVKYRDGIVISTLKNLLFIKNDNIVAFSYPLNYEATFTHKICTDDEYVYIPGSDNFFMFDSYNIISLSYEDGKSRSTFDNYMKSCFLDEDGNVWICTKDKIFKYDKYSLEEIFGEETQPAKPFINADFIDNNFWIFNSEGAFKEEDGNFIKYDFGLDYGTWRENIMDIIPAEDGNMWVIANKPRLWDGEKFIDSVDYSNSGIHYENIEGMRKDKYGNLWFFDSNKGISMYRKGGINSVEDLPVYNPEVYIYPNPANGKINFELPEEFNAIEARIYNIEGKLVLEEELTGNEINLNSLTCGSYIIEFSDKKTRISKKVEIVK